MPQYYRPLTYSDVGIFEFVSPAVAGFAGRLKWHFSDFVVKELTPDGSHVALRRPLRPRQPKRGQEEHGDNDGERARKRRRRPTHGHDGGGGDDGENGCGGMLAAGSAACSSERPFLRFVLAKAKKSTMDVVSELASVLNRPERDFGYSGLKDCVAITAQRMTLYKARPDQLTVLRLPNVLLGDCE